MKAGKNKKKGVSSSLVNLKKSKSGLSSRLMFVMKSMTQIPSEDTEVENDTEMINPVKSDNTKRIREKKPDRTDGTKAVLIKQSDQMYEANEVPLTESVKADTVNEINGDKVDSTIGLMESSEVKQKSSVKKAKPKKPKKVKISSTDSREELDARTIFVGNFDIKCSKRQLSKFFSNYGKIETIRLRSAAPAEPEISKKVAVIKRTIHPSRTTCNAYIRFQTKDMMEAALEANGGLFLDNHLRVDRSTAVGDKDKRCAVFVGNLPFECEDENLYRHFEDCGEITSVRIIRDAKFSSGKGFGYVNFKKSDSVEVALQLNGKAFMNRNLRIQRCVKKAKKATKQKQQQQLADNAGQEGQNIGFMRNKPNTKMSLKFMKNQKSKTGKGNKKPDKKNIQKNRVPMAKEDGAVGDFSGKKMMQSKEFKKLKKSKQKLSKGERKKIFVARHLTGAKPMKKKL